MAEERYGDMSGEDISRLLLEFKDYAVIRLSTDGIIQSWNMGAKYIYGYSFGEIAGKHFSVLTCVEGNENNSINEILKIAAKAGRREIEKKGRKKDGTTFLANIIITTLYNKAGDIIGFAHVTRDITVKKNLEEENRQLREGLEEKVKQRTRDLEVVNKELEAFSYSVSHDLRTPLRAISGYSMILKEDYETKLDAEGGRLLDAIRANAKMMGELIDDLLTFSKMARLEAIQQSVDMNRLVEYCLEKLLPIQHRPAVSVSTLPNCKGDNNMLRQVWYNLLDNAVKYTSKQKHPQIEIGSLANSQFHIYFVKDNGAGFDMKYADKLFGVFQRLHRQDEFEGTGLGLALSNRIISKHGGEMWAEAVPQQGAIFYFSIPKKKDEKSI